MHRIDHSTAAASLPAPRAAGTPGFFTRGNPVGGQPATIVTYEWANSIQEELMALIVAAGLTPDKANNGQVLVALRALLVDVVNAQTVNGIKTFGVSPLVPTPTAGDNSQKAASTGFIQAMFAGANVSIAANGYIKFPNGLMIQWAKKIDTNASSSSGSQVNSSLTLPTSFPTACLWAIANSGDDDGTSGQESSEHTYAVTAKAVGSLTVRAQRMQGAQTGSERFTYYALAIGN